MKTFAISLVTLILIVAAITANGFFVKGFFEEIITDIEEAETFELSEGSYRDALKRAGEKLGGNLFFISLTVGRDETEELFCLIAEADVYLGKDDAQFRAAVEKLIRSLKRIRSYQTFCVEGLLICTPSHRPQEADAA